MTISLTNIKRLLMKSTKSALTGTITTLLIQIRFFDYRENNSCLAAGDYLVIDLDADVASQYDWGDIGQEAGLAAIRITRRR